MAFVTDWRSEDFRQVTLLVIGVLVAAASASPVYSQDRLPPCPPLMPAAVAFSDGRSITGLRPSDFQAQVGGKRVELSSSPEDRTPKQIVLLLDASKGVNGEGWKLTTGLAGNLASGARPEDRLALVVFGASDEILDFSTPRQALIAKVAQLAKSRPPRPSGGDPVYDGLLRALELFDPAHFGDSIFLFAGGADRESRAGAGKVRQTLAGRGIRVFGFLLASNAVSGIYARTPQGDFPYDPDTLEIDRLAEDAGGALVVENTDLPWTPYHLTADRMDQLDRITGRMYSQIVMAYRIELGITVGSRPERWTLDLAKEARNRFSSARVLYPHTLFPCADAKH